jgi:hypothetical protein
LTPEMLVTLTAGRSVQPFIVPGTGRPYWTLAEAGQAAAGLEPEIFRAMLYSYAGAEDCYRHLEEALVEFGEAFREEEEWPMQVAREDGNRSDYLRDLANVCLTEERHPWRFVKVAANNVTLAVSPFYLARMKVSEATWRKRLAHPYATLRWRYITWLSIGRAHMNRWMRNNWGYGHITEQECERQRTA